MNSIRRALVPALAVALAAITFTATRVDAADNGPSPSANKVTMAGASVDTIQPGASLRVLNTTIKTGSTGLLFGVTLECDIQTTVSTTGNESDSAYGQIKIWVKLDGITVPVATDDTVDPGKVIFCNRTHRQEVTGFATEQPTITQFLKTRTANAFNWLAPSVGSGTHTVEVFAEFANTVATPTNAQGVIGKRTLAIEPSRTATGSTVTNLP